MKRLEHCLNGNAVDSEDEREASLVARQWLWNGKVSNRDFSLHWRDEPTQISQSYTL